MTTHTATHPPRPPALSYDLAKHVSQMMMTVRLMSAAIDRVDADIEQHGAVTAETVEFLRSVKEISL